MLKVGEGAVNWKLCVPSQLLNKSIIRKGHPNTLNADF